jgi:hypothetical protein
VNGWLQQGESDKITSDIEWRRDEWAGSTAINIHFHRRSALTEYRSLFTITPLRTTSIAVTIVTGLDCSEPRGFAFRCWETLHCCGVLGFPAPAVSCLKPCKELYERQLSTGDNHVRKKDHGGLRLGRTWIVLRRCCDELVMRAWP